MADNSYIECVEQAIDNLTNVFREFVQVEKEKNDILKGINAKLSDIAIIQSIISDKGSCCVMQYDLNTDGEECIQGETYFEKVNDNHHWRYYPKRSIEWL